MLCTTHAAPIYVFNAWVIILISCMIYTIIQFILGACVLQVITENIKTIFKIFESRLMFQIIILILLRPIKQWPKILCSWLVTLYEHLSDLFFLTMLYSNKTNILFCNHYERTQMHFPSVRNPAKFFFNPGRTGLLLPFSIPRKRQSKAISRVILRRVSFLQKFQNKMYVKRGKIRRIHTPKRK